jgi:hypothetical protein
MLGFSAKLVARVAGQTRRISVDYQVGNLGSVGHRVENKIMANQKPTSSIGHWC